MVRESYAEPAGRRVRYLDAGAGWPLLLIHAFPLSADMWRPQLDRAPKGWRFIAPDVRGFGPVTSSAAVVPTIDQFAGDVVDLLDELRIDRAMIGGLSMGGYIALALLKVAPERCNGLVLANTRAAGDSPEGRQAREQMAETVRADGPGAVADQMLPKLLGDTSRRARPHLEPMVRRMIESNGAAGIEGALQAMKDRPDSTPLLARVASPALVIAGEEDVIIPMAEAESLHAALPRSHFVQLPAAGHLSNLEVPDDFSEALNNFLHENI